MAKGKLILICQSGGDFVTNDDGTMSYNGGEANAANVTSETPFSDLKQTLAETCDLNQETVTVKYFLPGNKRNLITVKNDKDVRRMIDFHGDAITAEVFVTGTPGFIRSAVEKQTNRYYLIFIPHLLLLQLQVQNGRVGAWITCQNGFYWVVLKLLKYFEIYIHN